MKYGIIGLMCLAAPLGADTLCNITDDTFILSELEGTWDVLGGLSYREVQTANVVDGLIGTAQLDRSGRFALEVEGQWGDAFYLRPTRKPYDADDVADLLERTNAAWIFDQLADGPCTHSDFLQLRDVSDDPNGDFNQVTIVPYSTDQVLMIAEVEALIEGRLAFVTLAGLMTPTETDPL